MARGWHNANRTDGAHRLPASGAGHGGRANGPGLHGSANGFGWGGPARGGRVLDREALAAGRRRGQAFIRSMTPEERTVARETNEASAREMRLVLYKLATDSTAPEAVRVHAANKLLDRIEGKAAHTVQEFAVPEPISDEAANAILENIRARLAMARTAAQ